MPLGLHVTAQFTVYTTVTICTLYRAFALLTCDMSQWKVSDDVAINPIIIIQTSNRLCKNMQTKVHFTQNIMFILELLKKYIGDEEFSHKQFSQVTNKCFGDNWVFVFQMDAVSRNSTWIQYYSSTNSMFDCKPESLV